MMDVCECEREECVSIFKSNRTKTFQCLFNVISLIFRYAFVLLSLCGKENVPYHVLAAAFGIVVVAVVFVVVIGTLLNYGVLQRIQCLKSLQLYQQMGMRTVSNFERMNKCLLMLLLLLLLLLLLMFLPLYVPLLLLFVAATDAVCLLIPLFNTQCCSILRGQTRKLHVTMRKLQYKSIDSNYVALHFIDVNVLRALMRINALLLKHISTIPTHKIQNQKFSQH